MNNLVQITLDQVSSEERQIAANDGGAGALAGAVPPETHTGSTITDLEKAVDKFFPELAADLIDDGPAGQRWLEEIRNNFNGIALSGRGAIPFRAGPVQAR